MEQYGYPVNRISDSAEGLQIADSQKRLHRELALPSFVTTVDYDTAAVSTPFVQWWRFRPSGTHFGSPRLTLDEYE